MSSQQQTWTSLAAAVKRTSYENLEIMSAVIAPTGATSVTLQFTSFDTEKDYDFVTIKSCAAVNCSQSSELGKYSGSTIPSPVTSDTGIMLIQWKSDISIILSGWSANWSSLAPGGKTQTVPMHILSRHALSCKTVSVVNQLEPQPPQGLLLAVGHPALPERTGL
jgi:hypothetical protein